MGSLPGNVIKMHALAPVGDPGVVHLRSNIILRRDTIVDLPDGFNSRITQFQMKETRTKMMVPWHFGVNQGSYRYANCDKR